VIFLIKTSQNLFILICNAALSALPFAAGA
jgi:hypothetical protein